MNLRLSGNSSLIIHHSSLRKSLGQYFTPEPVVDLCYRMLRILDPQLSNPRIMDPACGEGAFLLHALNRGITAPDRLFGIEKDPDVAAAWSRLRLPGLTIGDGLCTPNGPPDGSFDWVVGNPPYGTLSMTLRTDPSISLEEIAERFHIWRDKPGRKDLARYPMEVLFLERFVRLARPGGCIAVVIPDGILANARLRYVREWLCGYAEVAAVISLPRTTFYHTGAAAKSSILLLRKRDNPSHVHHSISMADLESSEPLVTGLDRLVESLAAFTGRTETPVSPISSPPWLVYPISGLSPGDRLDPAYYHPRYMENLRVLRGIPGTVTFGDLIEFTTYGQVGAREYTQSGVRLLTPANLRTTGDGYAVGVDMRSPKRYVPDGSWNDPPRSRLRKGDLLLANSGVGCIGRVAVFFSDEPCNISQHINLVRVKGIEPEYLAVYLQTRFGRLQIHREKCGVGASGINFGRIRSILVPILPEDVREKIVQGYRRAQQSPTSMAGLVSELESIILNLKT